MMYNQQKPLVLKREAAAAAAVSDHMMQAGVTKNSLYPRYDVLDRVFSVGTAVLTYLSK